MINQKQKIYLFLFRILICGLGSIGRRHFRVLRRHSDLGSASVY